MTIRISEDGTIRLEGQCSIEDAEPLQRHLLANARAAVDWTACDTAHTAIIQILLVARPALRGPPRGEFLRLHAQPLLWAIATDGSGPSANE